MTFLKQYYLILCFSEYKLMHDFSLRKMQYQKVEVVTEHNDTSEKEADFTSSEHKKQKEEVEQTSVNRKVSFLESLIFKTEEYYITYVTQGLDNISFHDEQENPQNHPNFIPIASSNKQRLYTHWKQSLIIKLVGKRMGYLHLSSFKQKKNQGESRTKVFPPFIIIFHPYKLYSKLDQIQKLTHYNNLSEYKSLHNICLMA